MSKNKLNFLDCLFAEKLLICANARCSMHSHPPYLRRHLELPFRWNQLIVPIKSSRRIRRQLIFRGKLCSNLVRSLLFEPMQFGGTIRFNFVRFILSRLNKRLDHLPLTCEGLIDSLTTDQVILQHGRNDVLYSHFFPQCGAFATGGANGTVTLWHRSKACVNLQGHGKCITSLQFDPSNPSIVATASRDSTAKLWRFSPDGSAATCVATLDHNERVTCIAFHPNRSLLLTGSDDQTAKLWKLSSDDSPATCIDTLEQYPGIVTCVAFHHIAPFMVTISDERLMIWGMPTGSLRSECINSFEVHGGVQSVALHPRDPFLVVGCKLGDIILMHLDPGNFNIVSTNVLDVKHTNRVVSIAFHETAPVFAAISTDALNLWKLSDDYLSATCVANIAQNNRGTYSFSVEFDASTLYTKIGTNYQVWR
jgi:WD40 repeat protein